MILKRITDDLSIYVSMSPDQKVACALWIVSTHLMDIATYAPRLNIHSPLPNCGKSTALRVIKRLVPKPQSAESLTRAAIYYTVDADRPSVLLDEGDYKLLALQPELVAVLNSGHEVEGRVGLMVPAGKGYTLRYFSTFSALAIAGIGKLRGPLGSRCIPIAMQRPLASERDRLIPFDRDEAGALADTARMIARWALDNTEVVKATDPKPLYPYRLKDGRQRDNWRLMLKIAKAASPEWLQAAQDAATALSAPDGDEDDDIGLLLLSDIVDLYAPFFALPEGEQRKSERSIFSADLCKLLHGLDDRPWNAFDKSGGPITTHRMARLLATFGIRPQKIRIGSTVRNGYYLRGIVDARRRYCPPKEESGP